MGRLKGRPNKNPRTPVELMKDRQVYARVTKSEHARLKELAKDTGMTVSDLIRLRVLVENADF